MSRRIGSLAEWLRFLDTRDAFDAGAKLASYSLQIDTLHDDLGRIVVALYDSPTGEVADDLVVARTALAEAAGLLDSVKARFENGGLESA